MSSFATGEFCARAQMKKRRSGLKRKVKSKLTINVGKGRWRGKRMAKGSGGKLGKSTS